ncbi:MAG: response regulator [bacterium]
MPDNEEKKGLSEKDIKDFLGLACLRKTPIEITYEENRYHCSGSKAVSGNIILDFISPDDVKKFSSEIKPITATFVLENKRYLFQCKARLEGGALKLDYPESMRPAEARRFFRVEPRLDETIPLILGKYAGNNVLDAKLEDISAGGLKFFTQINEYSAGEKVIIGFFLTIEGNEYKIVTDAIIRHVRQVRLTAKAHCGIQFLELDKEKKDVLVKFISMRQLEERKRATGQLISKPKLRPGKEALIKSELKDSILQVIAEFKEANIFPTKEFLDEDTVALRKKKILIIDPDAESVDSLKFLFEPKYEIGFDASALDGINKALFFLPDIIFLEIDLAGLDGFKVCKILKTKEQTKNIPIIMISKRNTREDVVTALSLGASGYIVKPFDLDDVLKRTEEILGK